MPYDPHAPSERERSAPYFVAWIGLAASLAALLATWLPISDRLRGLCAAIVGLELVIFALSGRFDSYFRQLRDFGAVVALAIVALWLAVHGLAQMSGASYAAGVAVGGGSVDLEAARFVLPAAFDDPWLLAAAAATGFHAGFLWTHLRGGRVQ